MNPPPTQPVLVMCAMESEARAVRAEARRQGVALDVVVIGIGAGRTPQTGEGRRVIVAGVGGGLVKGLTAGDVVVDRGDGRICSVERVVETPTQKQEIAATGASVVDMELGAVRARLGQAAEVIGVRAVLDDVTTVLPAWMGTLVDEVGRVRPGALAWAILQDPRRIGELLAMGKKSKAAYEAFARATVELARTL